MALIAGFTGPLSRVPGPVLMKLTRLPWILENLTGNVMNSVPKLFEKYGDVVRVSESVRHEEINQEALTHDFIAPDAVLFASKDAAQKIVIEDDLLKSPEYEMILADPKITNLITERDRVLYRQKVWSTNHG